MKVVYYGAEHCPQCRALQPQVELWCKEKNVPFEFRDADSGEWDEQMTKYNIKSIPVVVVINAPQEVVCRGIGGWNEFVKENRI